jgi:hypothetical protein
LARSWPRAVTGHDIPCRSIFFGGRGKGRKPEVEEFYPEEVLRDGIAAPVVFGLPETENEIITKAMAKEKYLLRDSDFARLKPFYNSTLQHSRALLKDEDTPYLVQDIERATMQKYGSEKEFRREQLRREIKRRRRSGRSSISDLEWDPALGKRPESVIKDPVGQRAVHTAIATNSVVMASKMVAFCYTGSASVLSEVIHSLADVGNQCLLAIGISQSLREADASHPYGYSTDRYVWSLISGVGIFFLGCGVSIYHGFLRVSFFFFLSFFRLRRVYLSRVYLSRKLGLITLHHIEHYEIVFYFLFFIVLYRDLGADYSAPH